MTVSTSPLELVAQVFLLCMVGTTQPRPPNGQVVMRCDNTAAVDVVASRRAKSAAMKVALLKLELVERTFNLNVRSNTSERKKNVLTDALSRGDDEAARTCLVDKGLEFQEFEMDTLIDGLPFSEFVSRSAHEVSVALLEGNFGRY